MAGLFDFFNEGDKITKLDPNQENFYDPDTTKQGHRILGVDAPEKSGIAKPEDVPEGRHPLSTFYYGEYEQEHRQQIEDAVAQGYDTLRHKGKDVYDRPLTELEMDHGFNFAVDYTKEGLLGPSRYDIDNANLGYAHNYYRYKAWQNERDALPTWRQAEMLHKEALAAPVWESGIDYGGLFSPLDGTYKPGGAFSPTESIEYWWMTNKTAFAGLASMFDEDMGKKMLSDVEMETRERIDPNLVLGFDQINDPLDALAWIGNNAIAQGPDFAILLAGGALGGPLGAAAALGYTWLKSTGMVSSEMMETHGEVDVGKAIGAGTAIALIDKIGAKGLVQPTELFTKEGKEKLVRAYMDQSAKAGKPISFSKAESLINKTALNDIKDYSQRVGLAVDDLVSQREITMGIIKRIAMRSGEEGATEATQEAIQYITVHGVPETAEEWKTMGMRLAESAAAGGVVGGLYTTPQTLYERAQIQDFKQGFEYWDSETANRYEQLAKASFDEWGVTTTEEAVNNYKAPTAGDTLEARTERNNKGYFARGFDKLRRGDYKMFAPSVYNTFQSLFYKKNGAIRREAVLLANIFGGAQSMAGGTMYDSETAVLGKIQNEIPWMLNPEKYFDMSMDDLNALLLKFRENNLQVNDSFSDKQIKVIDKIHTDLAHAKSRINDHAGFQKTDVDYDEDPASLFSSPMPNRNKVRDNTAEFIEKLSRHVLPSRYGDRLQGQTLGKTYAKQIADMILSSESYPALRKQLNALELSKSEVSNFFEDSPLLGIADNIIDQTRYANRVRYLGKDYEVISNLINDMVNDPNDALSQEIADELAADIKDQLDKGNNIFGRGAEAGTLSQKAIEWTRLATTMGVMDYSFFAQAGEVAFSMVGTNKNILTGIAEVGRNFGKAAVDFFRKEKSEDTKEYLNQGYNAEETTQQQGARYDDRLVATINKYYFHLIGTAPLTDAVRMARAGQAAAVMNNLVASIADADLNNPTKFQMKQMERIIYYGGNVKELIEVYNRHKTLNSEEIAAKDPDDPDLQTLYDNWNVMVPKFIDEFVVRTKPGSRPGIFEEKRFGIPLFTQFLSFTSHWAGNQLPRFYNAYTASGGTMAYQAFATGASAILAAFLSQFMKDWLKYGEESPWLAEDWSGAYRAFMYSGLLGWTAEADTRFGIGPYGFGALYQYFEKDKELIPSLVSGLASSPSIEHLSSVAKDVYDGDYEKAIKKGVPLADLKLDNFYNDEETSND